MNPTAAELPPPHGWGEDLLTNFFNEARNGAFASYVNFPRTYQLLRTTAQTFEQTRQVIQNSADENEEALALMALRSYGYFMSASQAALSGQVPEANQMARACLEAAVYAFRIAEQRENVQIWFDRHTDDEARKASRRLFGWRDMIDAIRTKSATLADAIDFTYDTYIDFGGHPNIGAIAPYVSMESITNASGDIEQQHQLALITDDPLHIQASCNSVARGGILSLRLIHLIFLGKIAGSAISSLMLALQGELMAHYDEVVEPLMTDFESS